MSELKPCPFCGEEPEIFDFTDGRFIVECVNPDCDVYPYTSIHRDRAGAIAAWNQRATVYTKPTTLSQLQEDNAKLRELVLILLTCASDVTDCDKCPVNGGAGVWDFEDFCDGLPERVHELRIEVDG